MKTQAIHKLLDLAKRLPSIEILDSAEVTPLLEAVRAIKAAEGELEAACDVDLENERFGERYMGDVVSLSDLDDMPATARRTFSLSS